MFKKPILTAALLLGGSMTQLYAHAHLAQSEPAEDAVLNKTPATVSIEYTDALELGLSKLVLKDESGATIETSKPEHIDGNPPKTLSVTPPALKPGTYTVGVGRCIGRYAPHRRLVQVQDH
ncbi:hypothetical protein Q644_19525 [Brucella intermedia 229E]|uniref:CopC domain-containing protein n=1 Tax=Brucella intermedia 229E TaxID=1337887 RepID=U4VG88_9HYPH|nr:hypothetical protein Q644_19525 [Brucella intermedia 229E]